MTLKECYDMFGGDYEDVSRRLPSEKLIEKFFLKFQDDKSYENLQNALKEGDYEEAFRAAHTLKGVAQNLSFKNLGQSSSSLTEALRAKKEKPGQELVEKPYELEKLCIKAKEIGIKVICDVVFTHFGNAGYDQI